MNGLNLKRIAVELLEIDEVFHQCINSYVIDVSHYTLHTFVQCWGNTSGGFEGVGGSAMTNQNTYVFIPKHDLDDICLVFFGGTFAYKIPMTDVFMEDVKNHKVKGLNSYKKYLEREMEDSFVTTKKTIRSGRWKRKL